MIRVMSVRHLEARVVTLTERKVGEWGVDSLAQTECVPCGRVPHRVGPAWTGLRLDWRGGGSGPEL